MRPQVVVGGRTVGLAAARALQPEDPGRSVLVLEKESGVTAHQTGHSSGVIHPGLSGRPCWLMARRAIAGAESLTPSFRNEAITCDVPGKVVVAITEREVAPLDRLLDLGTQNGVAARRVTHGEIAEGEPHIPVLAAIEVPSTGRLALEDVCRFGWGLSARAMTRSGKLVDESRFVRASRGPARAQRPLVGGHGLPADRGPHRQRGHRAVIATPSLHLPHSSQELTWMPSRTRSWTLVAPVQHAA
ncbi:MAG: FAD-dependent oxidoreductase [Nocardioides sp.]|nr:FAD-dependent oxidoreductase [Nocardioides sp.]